MKLILNKQFKTTHELYRIKLSIELNSFISYTSTEKAIAVTKGNDCMTAAPNEAVAAASSSTIAEENTLKTRTDYNHNIYEPDVKRKKTEIESYGNFGPMNDVYGSGQMYGLNYEQNFQHPHYNYPKHPFYYN